MYTPSLKYVFCVPRVYQLDWHLPLYRYLNSVGVIPRILIGDGEVPAVLRDNNIVYESLADLPDDYDIFVPLATGFMPFTRYWLEASLARDKVNLWVLLTPLPFECEGEFICPTQTRFLHAMCVSDARTISVARRINSEVLMLNTGHPLWDNFETEEFRTEVGRVKRRYGRRLLVVPIDHDIPNDYAYAEQVIEYARNMGFQAIVQAHPGLKDKVPQSFRSFLNPGIDRYVLFSAASHVICFLLSTMSSECLRLGANVACKPLGIGPSCRKPGDYEWFNDIDHWYACHRPLFDPAFFEAVPLVYDPQTLTDFLQSDHPAMQQDRTAELFGWPRVPCYCEHLFRTVESTFAAPSPEVAEHIAAKTAAEKNLTVDFSWKLEGDISQLGGIKDAAGLARAATQFLKQGNIEAAQTCLRRAERFSGREHYDFVQYAQALCYAIAADFAEARKSIYRALFNNPTNPNYLELKAKIDDHRTPASSVNTV